MSEEEIRKKMEVFNENMEENKIAQKKLEEIERLIGDLPKETQIEVFDIISDIFSLLSDGIYKSLKEAERLVKENSE